jgi:molybdopterin synthase sulfur carrier subunit
MNHSPRNFPMKIELRLYASLSRYLPEKREGNSCDMEIAPGTTINELLRDRNIPPEAPRVIFLNGVHARGDEILKEGDRIGAFPPVAGG